MILPDLLRDNLKVVFCGTAVGKASAKQSSYYAGCGNKFYCVLYKVGITPVQLIPEDYEKLLDYDIGLTDLVKFKYGTDKQVHNDDSDIPALREKILYYSPKVLCFNGKEAATWYFNIEHVDYGKYIKSVGRSKVFVVPSTSPKAHKYWDEKYWKQLKQLIDE